MKGGHRYMCCYGNVVDSVLLSARVVSLFTQVPNKGI